ncbi:MAG: threonine ammonia-lyase [Calditerrivibrio sp.]|nr:threonine ammonia-lyase [Calditerrivibrio sp.]
MSVKNVHEAYERIKPYIKYLPLYYSNNFSEPYKANIYFKMENLQRTGSFKLRGALNAILKNKHLCQNGVITASAGNHAQGVAFGCNLLNIPSVIVMPTITPLVKVANTKSYGAEVILHGNSYDDAYMKALQLAKHRNLFFVHPFNDEDVIDGQGTIAYEILKEKDDIDIIVVPIGGGGLISGIAKFVKSVNSDIKVIGVQAENAASMYNSLKKGTIIKLVNSNTIAEGIAVKEAGDKTFEYCKKYVDDIILVSENDIAYAILQYIEKSKLVVEGAGAAPLATILSNKLSVDGKNVVMILSGGNIDVNLLTRVFYKGLASTGRFLELNVILRDIPGSLANLTKDVAELGANVLDIRHFRYDLNVPVGSTKVILHLETKGFSHIEEIIDTLGKKGYEVNIYG